MKTNCMLRWISEKCNVFSAFRIYRMRKQIMNKNVSFLVPNCIGGILFHDLGLKFQSPTVNLMMTQPDFKKFILNLENYLAKEFEFIDSGNMECPRAKLGDITVYFTHYRTQEDAESKWKERTKRINRDNIFVFLEERDGLSREDILELGTLNVRGLVIFTANEYPDIPYTVYVSKYHAVGEIGNILRKSFIDNRREYEKYFDFIKWFNESEGSPYDVTKYKR